MSVRKPLDGKTALVTGSGKRIGRSCALALANMGARVIVHYNHSKSEALETAAALDRITESTAIKADLTDKEQIDDLFDTSVKKFGSIDILVNSASVFPSDSVLNFTVEDYTNNFAINAFAPLLLSRLLAGQKTAADRRDIINFLDTRITDFDKKHAAYHLSKRDLFAITRMLALELAPEVRVNAIAPGLILPPPGESEEYLENLKATNPLGKTGSLDDITRALVFLLTNEFITGQVLFIDGGRHLKGSFYGT